MSSRFFASLWMTIVLSDIFRQCPKYCVNEKTGFRCNFLYLDSVFKYKNKFVHNQAPIMNRLCPYLMARLFHRIWNVLSTLYGMFIPYNVEKFIHQHPHISFPLSDRMFQSYWLNMICDIIYPQEPHTILYPLTLPPIWWKASWL